MKKIICILILTIPIICSSQNNKLNLRIWAFTNYDAWTHMDPVYLDEPNGDVDNFRPVEYEERKTELRLGLDQLIMEYGPGMFGADLFFIKRWSNRKHISDGDSYFEYGWPMTPYQTRSDYLRYRGSLYYSIPMGSIKPYLGAGGEFTIDQTSSSFIYIDNQTNAGANPYASIPVDEHVERRFGYFLVAGVDCVFSRYFYVRPLIRLYFNEIDIDSKMIIKDQTDAAQFRPSVEIGFIF